MQAQPLATVAAGLAPDQEALLAAWQALGRCRYPDAETRSLVRLVLERTVPAEERQGALPPLPELRPDTLRRATAAHPRAYRGTIFQPPKRPAAAVIDLRPYLCGAAGVRQAQAWLREPGSAARRPTRAHAAKVPSAGEDDRIAARTVGRHAAPPQRRIGAGDDDDTFTSARRQPIPLPRDAPELPHPFRVFLSPALRGLDGATVCRYLAVYQELELGSKPALLAAVACLAARQRHHDTLGWCRHLVRQSEDRRLAFTNLLLATGADAVPAGRLATRQLEDFDATTPPDHYAYRLCCLFRALRRGIDVDYLLAGFRLADHYRPDAAFHALPATLSDVAFPAAAVDRMLDHVRSAGDWYP